MNLGAGPIPPQGDQPNRRRKKNKKRRRRSADPGDIEDDINSVTSKLMDKQKKGLDVQFGELINEVSSVMLNHIDNLQKEVANIRYPQGTRENPAITCREIKLGHPASKSGWYWIDPNLGSIDDAIKVHCNMTDTPQTCVHATQRTKMAAERTYSGDNRAKSFKKLKDGFEIRYASSVQMDFLRLLAAEATQTFTYLCSGSVAWFDVDTNDLTNAISLIGANDHVFDTENFNERQVIHDGCQNRDTGGFTTFEIKTAKLARLPIVNFRPKDYGQPWQKFGFEAGPICFQ